MPTEKVGILRTVNLHWLDSAAEMAISGLSREDASKQLYELIHENCNSIDTIKQTRAILLHTWFDSNAALLSEAKELYSHSEESIRPYLHYGLLLCSYPYFYDLCDCIGHLSAYKEKIYSSQAK